jgi:hypothetical protein
MTRHRTSVDLRPTAPRGDPHDATGRRTDVDSARHTESDTHTDGDARRESGRPRRPGRRRSTRSCDHPPGHRPPRYECYDPEHGHYDPWLHVAMVWPELDIVSEPMTGSLLGELRYPVIALRADSSAAQRRCTLAHELVHLERGVPPGGLWAAREELIVHAVAARRLIRLEELGRALRDAGGDADLAALARGLEADSHTVRTRLAHLTAAERRQLRADRPRELWDVA